MKRFVTLTLLVSSLTLQAQIPEKAFNAIESKVVSWRRDIHQNPELSNREFKTAEKVAAHLRRLGIEVQTGVAHTGVVGILKGRRPGKVVALRADMDALPVEERNDLPYRSQAKGTFMGNEVPVMHACGHDTHVAILMGVAEVMAKNNDFAGTVKFIFQPAEEGPPPGETGAAKMMVEQGVLRNPDVDAIFGLHINSGTHIGKIKYKPGGTMAASQRFVITIKGKQAHGSTPWQSKDPIVIAAQIIDGLQTIVSRNSELTKEAAVISVGSIHGGVRFNIIPEEVTMVGTIRTLDPEMKEIIRGRMQTLVPKIAAAYDAEATVDIQDGTAITYNNLELTKQMLPTLENVAGKENVILMNAITGAEDFSYYQQEVPGLFFFLGGTPLDVKEENAPSHHTPDFMVDDRGLLLGVKALTQLTLDYFNHH